MISAIELKSYMVSISILSIIVSKLYHKKKPYLVILFKVDKGLEIGFYCTILFKIDKGLEIDFYHTILPLSLAVYLWIKSDGEFLCNAKKIELQWSKLWGE